MNKSYFLALNRIEGIGPRTIIKLLQQWPNLADLFRLSITEMEATGLSNKLATAICQANLNTIQQDVRWEKAASNRRILCWDDELYPALLKEIHDPPVVLYAEGDLSCLNQTALAMVGTRKPSVSGSETAFRFAHELAAHNITIVSGLALGIDAQVHQGCLHANGSTIAVLGSGIDIIYPYRHRSIAEKIKKKGLIFSEFPLGKPPSSGHFPQRNRIISGLSAATLVIEAAIKSGSLITARLALEQNRDVLAIPGSINNPQARGCHHILQQGAKLVTCPADVLDELGCNNFIFPARETALSLATNNKNLVKCIGFEVTTVDQISHRCGLKVDEVACGLAELELQGIVKAVPGGYMRCY